jgi:hypothetical protein
MANTTFTYLSGLLTDANKITQQRAQNLQNLSGIQRANSIANAGYAGGYRRSNQPTQKYTASESAQLKTLAANAANVNIKVPENIVGMTSMLSQESVNKLKSSSDLTNKVGMYNTSVSLFGQNPKNVSNKDMLRNLFANTANTNSLTNKLSLYNTNRNKQVYNPVTRNFQYATTFKPLSKSEFEKSVFGDNITKSKFSDAEKNLIKASQSTKEYQALFAPSQEDQIKASKSGAIAINSKMNNANFRAYVNSIQQNKEYGSSLFKNQAEAAQALERQTLTSSVSTGLSDLAKKESELIAQHIKQPYLSMLDTTSYTNYIAEAKANEEKQIKNLLLYQAKPQEVNIKKDAQKFGDLATGAYQSAYNELEKSIAAAKTSYDSYVQTKKATKSGFEAILGTLDSTPTTASAAQHSLGDTNAATKRKELINQRLDRVSQFTGSSQPTAQFVDRPQ